MLDGGPIDVLTGDYLAELTASILYNQQQTRGEDVGYVGTFLKQLKEVAADCKARDIKIVTNAGGLNPRAWPTRSRKFSLNSALIPKWHTSTATTSYPNWMRCRRRREVHQLRHPGD